MSVVLVHWNAPDRVIAAVARLATSEGVVTNIVVVDNGSDADVVDRLRASLPDGVELLSLAENRGYSGGVNAALAASSMRPDAVFAVAAHDVLVTPDTLRILHAEMLARSDFGVLGPVHWDPEFTRRESAGGRFAGTAGGPLLPVTAFDDFADQGVMDVDFVSGAIMVIRMACFNDVGGFDPHLFAYWEDVDFCLSARARGWRVGVVPAAAAAEPGYSARYRTHAYLIARNHIFVVRKHLRPALAWLTALRVLARAARAFSGSVIPTRSAERRRCSRDFAIGRAVGMWHGLLGRGGPPPGVVQR